MIISSVTSPNWMDTELENQRSSDGLKYDGDLQMRSGGVVLLCLAIYFVYLPIAWYQRHSYVPIKPPAGAVAVIANIREEADGGFAYYTTPAPDDLKGHVEIYENDTPLGPADAPYDDVRRIGKGRYRPFRSGFAFSTTDNTNPRTNGRHYWIVRE